MEGKKLETSHRVVSVSDQYDHDFGTAMRVYKSDIKKIGYTACESPEDQDMPIGVTIFICQAGMANIEEIILREILSLYGYKINSSVDYVIRDDIVDIVFITDMPWSEYTKLEF